MPFTATEEQLSVEIHDYERLAIFAREISNLHLKGELYVDPMEAISASALSTDDFLRALVDAHLEGYVSLTVRSEGAHERTYVRLNDGRVSPTRTKHSCRYCGGEADVAFIQPSGWEYACVPDFIRWNHASYKSRTLGALILNYYV